MQEKSEGEEQAQNVEEVATPDVALQVASIEPDTVNAGTAFSAAIWNRLSRRPVGDDWNEPDSYSARQQCQPSAH